MSDGPQKKNPEPGEGPADNERNLLFLYVILTLAVAFTILALVLSILALVKATSNPSVGPPGATGEPGPINTAADFEILPTATLETTLAVDATTPQFIIFDANPLTQPVTVIMPQASSQNGTIYRFFNRGAMNGLLIQTQTQDRILNNINNPIFYQAIGWVISDGVNEWSINT